MTSDLIALISATSLVGCEDEFCARKRSSSLRSITPSRFCRCKMLFEQRKKDISWHKLLHEFILPRACIATGKQYFVRHCIPLRWVYRLLLKLGNLRIFLLARDPFCLHFMQRSARSGRCRWCWRRLRSSTVLHQTGMLQLWFFPVRARHQSLGLCSFCRAVRPLLSVVGVHVVLLLTQKTHKSSVSRSVDLTNNGYGESFLRDVDHGFQLSCAPQDRIFHIHVRLDIWRCRATRIHVRLDVPHR